MGDIVNFKVADLITLGVKQHNFCWHETINNSEDRAARGPIKVVDRALFIQLNVCGHAIFDTQVVSRNAGGQDAKLLVQPNVLPKCAGLQIGLAVVRLPSSVRFSCRANKTCSSLLVPTDGNLFRLEERLVTQWSLEI